MNQSVINIGIDEVGRGAWAGPLVLAAVYFDSPKKIKKPKGIVIRDSKMLTERQRKSARDFIYSHATHELIEISSLDIDILGIQGALKRGIQELAEQIVSRTSGAADIKIWIDGRRAVDLPYNHEYIIRGDSIMPIISAASIIAKVYRDRLMSDFAEHYPHYGFERHVGYGTDYHQRMLKKYGPCEIHRKSYRPIRELML